MFSGQMRDQLSATADIFVDLYAYRQRENKDPLEDWLTECLAVTMRALPATLKAKLLVLLSGTMIDDPDAFFAKHSIEILTQYSTRDAGRPDMLVRLDGQPWILFENKVAHGVSIREGDQGGDSHQLRGYADWLDEHGRECLLPRALVFVTHVTAPPEDFHGVDASRLYHGFHRTHTSWGALGRSIAALTFDLADEHHAKVLARALLVYLEEKNMSNEFPSSAAFSAAELYVSQADALENLVKRMWDELKTAVNFGRTADYQLQALTDEGSVSAWRFVAPGPSSPSRESFLQTGIWFPETGLWFDADDLEEELRGPQAYIYFGNGLEDSFSNANGELNGFMRPASNFLACKAINQFPTDPQVRGEQIIAWVAEQAHNLKNFLMQHLLIA
jgi:hypothetical protein